MTDHNPSEGDIVERLMQDRLMNPDYATRREAAAEITRLRELLRISPAMKGDVELAKQLRELAAWWGDDESEQHSQILLNAASRLEAQSVVTKAMIRAGRKVADGVDDTAFERIYLAMHSAKEG